MGGYPATPWRLAMVPASFRGAGFKVEALNRTGGRRLAPHEYAKRNLPYTEDMGRKAIGFAIHAYLIGPLYQDERDALIDALESAGPGLLIHPYRGQMMVNCGPYSELESRERGGYCEIEMNFIESGFPTSSIRYFSTQALIGQAASIAEGAAASALEDGMAGQQ